MNYKTSIGAIAAALALYASAGCKKDEPIVVHPRVGCSHRDCDNDNDNTYVKPSHDLEPKYGNRTRPELSRHNPFNEPGRPRVGTRYVIQLPEGYRAVTVVPGGPVITTRFRTVEGGAKPPKPNGTGSQGRSSGAGNSGCSSNTDPCYDSSRTPAERGRACAARLPTAEQVFGPESEESLEQRLRDCEEQNRELRQLSQDLETQLGDSMDPDRVPGRG